MFCELVVQKCRNLRYIYVVTVKDPKSNAQEQTNAFEMLSKNLLTRNITMNVEYSPNMHDRQIM